MPRSVHTVLVRNIGYADYVTVWQAMRYFTDQRNADSHDEMWVVEHNPVFTQGQSGRAEHLLAPGDIPVIQTDRGGQVTYHGPGQIVLYLLVDLRRRDLGIRQLVRYIEASVIQCLALYGIEAYARDNAPGVYVDDAKICSLGLRVRRGCSYHGLALNHHMDLTPFLRINPCGFKALRVVQVSDFKAGIMRQHLTELLLNCLRQFLGYNTLVHSENRLPIQQDFAHVEDSYA